MGDGERVVMGGRWRQGTEDEWVERVVTGGEGGVVMEEG